MSNALLLKKAMKVLDLSGAALARRLSQYREDGRVTATETVSRWVSGTNNVDPAVLAWLEELLRSKALESPKSLVEWPENKKSITIGITSPKGGVGTTTLAMNLAVAARKDFGITTNHVTIKGDRVAAHVGNLLKPLHIETHTLSYSEILRVSPDDKEVMIVDIPSSAALDALADYTDSFLSHLEPDIDILLVPADFGSGMDILHYSKLMEITSLKPKIRFVHRPRIMQVDFSRTAESLGLDVTSENFYPCFIPQAVHTSIHIPPSFFDDWADKEQQDHHRNLFEYIINTLGGETYYPYDVANKIRRMSLIDLLDHFENK